MDLASDDRPVLVQGGGLPIVRGGSPLGVDVKCHSCDSLLCERITTDQVLDVIFKCRCGAMTESSRLPPGAAMSGFVLLPSRKAFRLDSTLEIGDSAAALVGEPAVQRMRSERGATGTVAAEKAVTAEYLITLREKVRRTLGSAYPQLRAQHERSQKHKTPAKNPHHLMLLLAALEDAIAQLSSDVPTIDASAVAELEMLTELLDRWSAHPSREALLRELVDPDAFVHTLVLLAAAAYLTDAGNPVEIIAAHGAGRQCDLVIRPNRSAEVRVEIKTPRTLRARGLVQDVGVARRVVAAALSSAGTGSAGQLPHHKPGVLIVGGIRLNNEELMLLEQAGHTIMRERGAVLDHVMCLAFVGVGTLIIHDGGTRLQPSLHTRIAPNPYYRRETALSTGASTPQIRRPSAAEVSMSLDGRMAAWAFDRPD